MATVTVGLDIGTTSVKAVAVDDHGQVVARTRVPHELRVPAADRLEHDAARAWRDAPRQALATLAVDRYAAICVAALVPSLTAVDAAGRPQGPGLLYGDARGGRAGTGGALPAVSGEAAGFLAWLAAEFPHAAGYWPAQAVANHALCGQAAIDVSAAAVTFPLFTGAGWDPERLRTLGASPAQLPVVAGLGEAVGEVSGAAVASGLVDALGEQLVSGATSAGDVLVVLGATLLIWAVIPAWREVPGLWTIPHSIPGLALVGGASNAGGLFVDWVRRLTGAAPGRLQPGAVPVWEPHPRGERTPLHDPDRRAAVHGLDLTHGPAAILRAAYEASGFVVRHHLDLAGVEPRRIVAGGGGSRDPQWVQALADATGLPVDVAAVPEGAALGAAFVARMAAGLERDLAGATRWAGTARRVEPDPDWQGLAAVRYARFRDLVDRA